MASASTEIVNLAKTHQIFTLDLYKELRQTRQNLVFCPTSICATLTMLGAGARAATATQITQVLRIETSSTTSIHSKFTKLIAALTYKNPHPETFEVIIGNSLFAPKGCTVTPSYSKTLADRYIVSIRYADFQNNKDEASNDINTWVSSQTRNRITKVLDPSSLLEATRLVIINAVYVKGLWESKFEHVRTSSATFYRLDGAERQVEMMYQEGSFRYGCNDLLHCRILELPYKAGVFAMNIILPDDSDAFIKLEDSLNVDIIEILLNSLGRQNDVNVWLPRFKADVTINLHDVLPKVGISDAFSKKSADFSGISSEPLHVSLMLHKTVLAVDELGTDAASVTDDELEDGTWRPQPDDFHANRPFFYILRHKKLDAIVFIGRYTSP